MDEKYYYVFGAVDGKIKYFRIDRKTGKHTAALIQIPNTRGLGRYSQPGYLNYNYFFVPINSHQVVRIKIFGN